MSAAPGGFTASAFEESRVFILKELGAFAPSSVSCISSLHKLSAFSKYHKTKNATAA